MQNSSLVSVIMPAYNPEKQLLRKAIESVFAQTYTQIELIIGDDGSEAAIESYIDNIVSDIDNPNNINVKVVRSNVNKGISHARNHAIAHASGRWLVWLDADDTLQNDCIEKLMEQSTKYNLVIGECNVYEGDTVSRRKPKAYFEEAKKYFKTDKDPFLLNIISLQPQLLLKADFDEIGCFNENYQYAELTELFLRYIVKKGLGKINFIEDAVYNYNRNRENNLSKNRGVVFKQREQILSLYLRKIGITGKTILYNQRNISTGMQQYSLRDATTSNEFIKKGEGCIISEKTVFEGTATIGHYVLIGAHGDISDSKGIYIGTNVNIGSFTSIEESTTIGNNVVIDDKCSVYKNVTIGDNSKILYGAKIFSNSIIGKDCIVGSDIPERMILKDRVTFMGTVAHSYYNPLLDWDTTDEESPVVGIGSVIGVKSIIIGGVKIGNNCYVSAGEILRHDLPDNTVFLKGAIHPISKFKGLIKTRISEK